MSGITNANGGERIEIYMPSWRIRSACVPDSLITPPSISTEGGLIHKAQTVSVQIPAGAEMAIEISRRGRKPGDPDEFIRASLPASLAGNPDEVMKAF